MFRKLYSIKTINKRGLNTTKTSLNNYKDTVLLPKTKFPQKLTGRRILEQNKLIYEKCGFSELYDWQKTNLSKTEFVLHDGPPYANGAPHMGHAINKILKDVILRRKIIEGHKVHFRPGWDCHGLPIELKALNKSKTSEKNALNIRNEARTFASRTIEKQRDVFRSWGVLGDWAKPYLTYSPPYIENQLLKFLELYEKKFIYRAVKPVYWSPSSRTALAEAELEYNEKHKSPSVIVQLKLTELPDKFLELGGDIFALIWTTTPWTLPSNQAICYNPALSYSFAKSNSNKIYLIATDLVSSVSSLINENLEILKSVSGRELEGLKYEGLFEKNEKLPFLSGGHPTASKGTGLVHTAPAHGPDDFLVALNHKLKIKNLIDETGCFSPQTPQFSGLNVLTNASQEILGVLGKEKKILNVSEIIHSYPYDWRTKKPVIIRASEQWFIDTDSIKTRAIELLNKVKIYPEKNAQTYKNNFENMLKRRPYWCISRQRVWGTPIPVFYEKNGAPIINKATIGHLVKMLGVHGPDFWWKLPIKELYPFEGEVEKGNDILDIWFDSGISWSSVLGEKTADFYLEGVDQFTGWFQSSLITSVALRDRAPYRNIYVHGFVVDESGRKMSKSLGNVTDPQEFIKSRGVDVLRWWVVAHASQNPTESISENVVKSSVDEVQKIRNTLRFALSNSGKGFLLETPKNLRIVDKYMLHLIHEFDREVSEMFAKQEFNKVCLSLIKFLTTPVSAFYFSIIKDRLYCDSETNISRKNCQNVLEILLNVVSKACAPILPHLVEELYYFRDKKNSETFYTLPNIHFVNPDYFNSEVSRIMSQVLEIKKEINKLGNTTEFEVKIKVSENLAKDLEIFENPEELAELFQIADVTIVPEKTVQNFEIVGQKTTKNVCPRCRKYNTDVRDELCLRCNEIVCK